MEMQLLSLLQNKGKYCTGCEACSNVCPVEAITMKPDKLGFYKPYIEFSKCIDCGRCTATCPVLNSFSCGNTTNPDCYAVMANDELRKTSSSGGAFSIFANYVLDLGGTVFGAVMDEDLSVHHAAISDQSSLYLLQKSKYTQSRINDSYRKVRQDLKDSKYVLFSGTPCQVAGLYAFLGKHPEKLLTIDVLCHGVPSQKMLKDSLNKEERDIPITNIDFRDKDYGWDSLAMTLSYADGSKKRLSYNESRYEQGFHPGMTLRDSCYDCVFCEYPRQGDLSIGDFWRIEETYPELSDGKGTSAVLLNSSKGQQIFEKVQAQFSTCRKVPLTLLSHNRVTRTTVADPGRDYFLSMYPDNHDFNTSVYYAQQGKYDIGLVGNWSYPNYGSELTYYALYEVLKKKGCSVCMFSWPRNSEWPPYDKPQLFLHNPYKEYEIAPIPQTREGLFALGEKCSTYILGSDQLLNNNLYRWFNRFAQLDWVPDSKQKVAYSASFGTDYIWGEQHDHAELAHFLQKFDAFSVREKSGQRLLHDIYGVESTVVLDPVFMVDHDVLDALADKGKERVPAYNYLFAYILDPNKEKEKAVLDCSKKLNLKAFSVSDAAPDAHKIGTGWDIETQYGVKLEEWIACIRSAQFMITDSFHGMCIAILFQKPFVAIANAARGNTRFHEILGKLGLSERVVSSLDEIADKQDLLDRLIDYKAVNSLLEKERSDSFRWLDNALIPKKPLKSLSDFDILAPVTCGLKTENQKQWGPLEDHKLRLNGIDDRLNNQDVTNTKQWGQLEDHKLRLDGVDDKINILQQEYKKVSDLCSHLKEQNNQLEEQNNLLKCRIADLENTVSGMLAHPLKYFMNSRHSDKKTSD